MIRDQQTLPGGSPWISTSTGIRLRIREHARCVCSARCLLVNRPPLRRVKSHIPNHRLDESEDENDESVNSPESPQHCKAHRLEPGGSVDRFKPPSLQQIGPGFSPSPLYDSKPWRMWRIVGHLQHSRPQPRERCPPQPYGFRGDRSFFQNSKIFFDEKKECQILAHFPALLRYFDEKSDDVKGWKTSPSLF